MRSRLLVISTAALALVGCKDVKELLAKGQRQRKIAVESGLSTLRGGPVVTVTAENFDAVVDQSDKVVIIDFWAPWCGPCVQLGPVLEDVAAEYEGRVVVGKVNVDEETELAARFQVRSIPDLHFYRNGKRVDRVVGARPKEALMARIEPHLEPEETPAEVEEKPAAARNEAEPTIEPMKKGWLPPGVERR